MGKFREYFAGLKRPSQIIWLIIAGVTLLLAGGIAANVSPWLRGPDEWRWVYAIPGNWARHLTPLLAILSYAILVYFAARKLLQQKRASRRSHLIYLIFCTLSVPFLQLALLIAESPDVIEQLYLRTVSWGSSGFFSTASIIDTPTHFLSNYPQIMPSLPVHPQRYPPGIPLLIYAGQSPLEWLGLTDTLGGSLRLYQCQDLTLMRIPNRMMAAAVVQMALPLLSGFVIFPLFGLSRRTMNFQTAVWTVALYPLVPSFALWAGRWDQFFPLLTVLAWYLLVRGLMAGKRPFLFFSGLLLGAATLLSFGLVVMLAPMGLWAIFYLWGQRNGRSPSQIIRTHLVDGLIFVVGLVSLWAIYQLIFGIGFLDIWRVSMSFHLGLGRSYWTWLGYHLYDFGIFLAVPIALLCLLAFGYSLRTVQRQLMALPLAFGLSVLLLDVSGTAQGEVARVWIFLTPFAVICAAWAATLLSKKTLTLGLLLGLMGLQLFTFNSFLRVVNTGLTAVPSRQIQTNSPASMQAIGTSLEQSITLLGYEANPQPVSSGETLDITLYWQVTDSGSAPVHRFQSPRCT